MSKIDPVVIDYQAITAYGFGIDICWENLLKNLSAISEFKRFDASHLNSQRAALINDITPEENTSLVLQILEKLSHLEQCKIPFDTDLILSSLNGEIDILESEILSNKEVSEKSAMKFLLEKAMKLFNVNKTGMIVSAACASSSIAVARAAAMIKAGKTDCVLVVSCDCVSEFLSAGFSSLMALDKNGARPFDKNRTGLSIGEAAAYLLLMSRERAEKEKRKIKGEILGWGMSCDANHMTGPDINGEGLVSAIEKAIEIAKISKNEIANISAHGTGTLYNDAMEIKAFKKVFGEKTLPAYSIKGGIGHTMGTAGLMDVLIALKTLEEKIIPPTVGTVQVDEDALGWISTKQLPFDGNKVLSTNSGFGGTNSALILGLN